MIPVFSVTTDYMVMMMMIVELNWPGGKMTDGPGWKDNKVREIRISGIVT